MEYCSLAIRFEDYTKYKQRIFTPEEEFEQYQYQLKQDYQRIQSRVQPDTHLSPKRFEQIIETYYTKKLFSKRFLARSSIQRFDIPSQDQIRSTPRSVTASRARSHKLQKQLINAIKLLNRISQNQKQKFKWSTNHIKQYTPLKKLSTTI
ncbi:hypothetical protein pb186bvf_008119 [Paramecium bursaria]